MPPLALAVKFTVSSTSPEVGNSWAEIERGDIGEEAVMVTELEAWLLLESVTVRITM